MLLNEALKRGNPVVFFDISIGGSPAGRLKMELFKKECPKTAENFRYVLILYHSLEKQSSDGLYCSQFCTGEYK